MPRKGENIYKRKDGRWEGRYIKGHNKTNRILYGYIYAYTYKEVKEKLNIAKSGIDSKKTVTEKKIKREELVAVLCGNACFIERQCLALCNKGGKVVGIVGIDKLIKLK